MLHIDGSMGEGGGQVLRTALSLALVTGRAFRIEKIRAGRERPGLARQHLAAVRAAAEIAGRSPEQVEGAALGSTALTFEPAPVRPGDYRFDIGSAGSVGLVLQTVLPPLLLASGPSRLTLCGGTHNPSAPPFEFLADAFLPLLARLGARVGARLVRRGFFPAGGGEMEVTVEPAATLGRLFLPDRGRERARRAVATVARLPKHIAERELRVLARALDLPPAGLRVEAAPDSRGPGNAVRVEVECERVTEIFTGFGKRGRPAEEVARGVAAEAKRYLASAAAVGAHLADQLLLPLALGEGGCFTAVAATSHATTNAEVIGRFLPVEVGFTEEVPGVVRVVVERRGSRA